MPHIFLVRARCESRRPKAVVQNRAYVCGTPRKLIGVLRLLLFSYSTVLLEALYQSPKLRCFLLSERDILDVARIRGLIMMPVNFVA
jgi:hypothetical protein